MSYTLCRRCPMRPNGSQSFLQQRRFQALSLFENGLTPVEIAHRLGVDRRSVRRWKAAYQSRGSKGLEAKSVPGRPTKLKLRDRDKLQKHLLRGAEACGFSTDLWTCPRIASVIRRHFKVDYHVDHVGRLLRSLGWSPQKPEHRARERDEKTIRTWVRYHWPRLKKKPKN